MILFRGFSAREIWFLAAVLLVGLTGRLIVGFSHYGVEYDIQSFEIMNAALRADWLTAYDTGRWAYPPGYLPWVALADTFSSNTASSFAGWVKLPAIGADIALAVVVQAMLGERGVSTRTRLASAGFIALAPFFWLISSWHGQIDAMAILPAVLALWAWLRLDDRRALVAGLLIGLGVCMKTVPIFMLLALLPSIRSKREGLVLLVSAVAVPLAMLVPFLLINPDGTLEGLRSNRGIPGFGGLSLLFQPELIGVWVKGEVVELSSLTESFTDIQQLMVAIGVSLTGFLLWRHRVGPIAGAAVIWLAVFTFNPNFTFQYLVWGLPFLLIAGRLGFVLLLQLVLLIPSLILYRVGIQSEGLPLGLAYTPLALTGWALLTFAFCFAVRSVIRDGGMSVVRELEPDHQRGPGRL